MNVKKAVVPAAGMGTRFLPATKAQPKEMLPVIDKPVIHFVIEELIESGIDDILIITGRGKRAIEDYFDKNLDLERHLEAAGKKELLKEVQELSDLVDVHYVRQKEQLGLGHAILCAERHIGDEAFAVLLGDTVVESQVPCTKQLMDISKKYNASSVAVEKVPKEKISRYGIIGGKTVEDRVIDIDTFVEKPQLDNAPSDLGMVGRYILGPEIFDNLKNTKPGVGGEVQLTDALMSMLSEQKIYGYEFDGVRYDLGNKFDYLKAIVKSGLEQPELSKEFREYLKSVT